MSAIVASLSSFATSVVDRAIAAGATAAEVYVRQGREAEIAVRNGGIEKLTEGAPKSVGIRLWVDDRSASTFATDFSDASIARLIAETLTLTKLVDPVPEAALIDAAYLASATPDLDLFDAGVAAVQAADKLARVRACEAAALGHDARVTTSGGASYSDLVMAHVLANSHGFARGYEESFVSYDVQVIADDDGGKKRNGMWYTFGRHLDQLRDAEHVGRTAAERAVRQLGAGPVPTAKLPVVFDPRAASALIGAMFGCMKGGAIERRASYLVDRVGTQVASPLVTLVDDPTMPRAPGSRPFDGEGMAARRTTFVDAGTLTGYALNSFSARKLGLQPTGHASRPASGSTGETSSNLFLAAGASDPEAIVRDVAFGFYCESMMGFGFNPVTGDFSRGASGRLIENGVLTRPVSEVTLSCNFLDLFGRIDAVGTDLEHDRSTCSPTIRVSEMTLAGS